MEIRDELCVREKCLSVSDRGIDRDVAKQEE